MSAASVSDVAVELGVATPSPGSVQAAQWQSWLDQAEMLIRVRLGDVNLLDQDLLAYVEVMAAALKAKNPDPVSQSSRQVSVDDGSVNTSSTWQRSSGLVEILPEWWDLLTPGGDGAAFSIGPALVVRAPGAEWPW